MSRLLKFASIGLLSLAMFAPVASAQRGRGFVRGGFGFGFGPGWGWYAPYSFWGPYGYYGEGYNTSYRGQVKIITQNKNAQVYVDGGYAGTAGKLKHFKLSPGQHDIELRDNSGKTIHAEVVTVIPGKTVDFDADMTPPKK